VRVAERWRISSRARLAAARAAWHHHLDVTREKIRNSLIKDDKSAEVENAHRSRSQSPALSGAGTFRQKSH
jgi:hypothetical protein